MAKPKKMWILLTVTQIAEVAEDLRGTCQSLEEVLKAHGLPGQDRLSMMSLGAIDDIVLNCEECGWWEEAELVNEDGICNDCSGAD